MQALIHTAVTCAEKSMNPSTLPHAPSSCQFSLKSALWQVSKQLVIHQLKPLPSAARARCSHAFSGCLCAQAEQALCSWSPCGRALTKLSANAKYKVSFQFSASRETQAPRTMDTCQAIAVIQWHFGSPNQRLLAQLHAKCFAISQRHWWQKLRLLCLEEPTVKQALGELFQKTGASWDCWRKILAIQIKRS